jgi:hypothetical protein
MLSVGVGALSLNGALPCGRGAAAPEYPAPALVLPHGTTGLWLNADPGRPAAVAWRPMDAVATPVPTGDAGAAPVLVHAGAVGGRLSSDPVTLTPDAACRVVAVLRRSQGRGDAVRMALTHASGEVRFDAAWRRAGVVIENVVSASGHMRLEDCEASSHEGDFIRLSATLSVAAAGPMTLGLGPVLPGLSGAVEIWGGGVAYDLPAFDVADGGAGDGLLWLDPAWRGWAAALRVEADIDAGAPLSLESGGVHGLGVLSPGAHVIRIRAVYPGGATDWSLS